MPMQEGVEEHVISTSAAAMFPSEKEDRRYGEFPLWREVPVLSPYRCEEDKGGKSNSAA